MKRIVDGLQEFQARGFEEERALFERLAHGQSPDVLFITCSDSRVVPNMLTGSKPGDLFIIRNAGNIVPPAAAGVTGERATIEYALRVLKVPDIVVCGHSGCGAVTGLLNPDALSELPNVAAWVQHAHRVFDLLDEGPKRNPVERLLRAIQLNALVQVGNLAELPVVRSALDAGAVRLHAWVYDIPTAHVEAFCGERNEWVDLVLSGSGTTTLENAVR